MKKEEVETLDPLEFCQIDEDELESPDDFVKYLWSILYNPDCVYSESADSLVLRRIEVKHRVDQVGNLKLEIRSDEHAPPHFHVIASGIDASFAIEDCAHLKGEISPRNKKKIECFFRDTNLKNKLIELWNKTRPADCPVGEYRGH